MKKGNKQKSNSKSSNNNSNYSRNSLENLSKYATFNENGKRSRTNLTQVNDSNITSTNLVSANSTKTSEYFTRSKKPKLDQKAEISKLHSENQNNYIKLPFTKSN